MNKHRRHQLNQKAQGKSQPEGDISLESAITELRKEVLAEVRVISSGLPTGSYVRLVDLDKELAELEQELQQKVDEEKSAVENKGAGAPV